MSEKALEGEASFAWESSGEVYLKVLSNNIGVLQTS